MVILGKSIYISTKSLRRKASVNISSRRATARSINGAQCVYHQGWMQKITLHIIVSIASSIYCFEFHFMLSLVQLIIKQCSFVENVQFGSEIIMFIHDYPCISTASDAQNDEISNWNGKMAKYPNRLTLAASTFGNSFAIFFAWSLAALIELLNRFSLQIEFDYNEGCSISFRNRVTTVLSSQLLDTVSKGATVERV